MVLVVDPKHKDEVDLAIDVMLMLLTVLSDVPFPVRWNSLYSVTVFNARATRLSKQSTVALLIDVCVFPGDETPPGRGRRQADGVRSLGCERKG
jgi:hypothetical protein